MNVSTVTVAPLLMLLANIFLISELFFEFSASVTVQLERDHGLVFPAVTICNINPMMKSK